MEITQDLLMKGKPTIIKGKEYLPTKDYVGPFFDQMSQFTDNFIIKVQTPNQVTITDGDEDLTYNRVWIQAVMPDSMTFENHQMSVSMLYALDTRQPVVKFFKNAVNMACLNMCVFSPEFLKVEALEPETPFNYEFVKTIMDKTDKTVAILSAMNNTEVNKGKIYDNLGQWIHRCLLLDYTNGLQKVKIAESVPINVYKNVYLDEHSKYYTPSGETNYFNIYNAFTDLICNDRDKDIINKYEKVWLVSKILNFN